MKQGVLIFWKQNLFGAHIKKIYVYIYATYDPLECIVQNRLLERREA